MTAVNWFCLVLAFAFIKIYVCIKVDPNAIPNGNYTTTSHTMQPYTKSTIISNETDNSTILGDTVLSASERTRRLIPYMAFYVPVSELPINKQYVSKNNILHTTKQLTRPVATAGGGTGPTGNNIPIPPQYVHSGIQYLLPSPSAVSPTGGQQQHYHQNAGLSIYHAQGYRGQYSQQQQQQQQPQQFHLLQPTTGYSHLQSPGPPGPSAAALPSLVGRGQGSGNKHNAFVTYKDINPIRQKTVQYFPPLSSTAASSSSSSSASASASATPFEIIRQTSSITKQQQKEHHHSGTSNNAAGVGYRPQTKQSKINLTPFSPSNTLPGNFVPIVYTPVNNNNNNNNDNSNNILNPHNAGGGEEIDNSSFNQHKQLQLHQHQHHHQQPQQIALEYVSAPLPPTGSAASIPLDMSARQQNIQQQEQEQQQHNHHHHNSQQQSQYYSVPPSPVNFDLTHDAAAGGAREDAIVSGDSANTAHHQHKNAETISPPITYHHNQHHHHEQQQQPERVIVDVPLQISQQPQMTAAIGSQHIQQQQLLHGVKSAIHFQPPKPENFFENDIQVQKQHNIEQVLKDVNSHSMQNSQMLTPQEKYVIYLQQRLNYNKHHQRHHATRYKYHEQKNNNNNNDKEREQQHYIKQHQQNPAHIFVLSSTMSPPTHDNIAVLPPVRPSQPPIQYESNFPQHSPVYHNLYPRPDLKTAAEGKVNDEETEEQVLTIPVHSLFSEMETLQHQQQKNHYPHYHSISPSSKHKSQYTKNGPAKPQHIEFLIDEPKQSLDEEQHQQKQPQQNTHQIELLKPTLGPPTHAFILVTTAAPFQQKPVTQEYYGSTLRPPYKNKPKIRLQSVPKDKNVNYPIVREPNPTERPHVVSITPTTPKAHSHSENDENPKYVYVKEEFGQKLPTTTEDETVKLKLLNKYERDDNKIPKQRHHQQNQHDNNDLTLQPLADKLLPTSTKHHHHNQHNAIQTNAPFTPSKTILADPNELPDIRTSSLAEILHKLQESNHLPHTLTPDNIDNSIKTLIRILNNLKQTQTIVANPPQHHEIPERPHPSSLDYDYTTGSEEVQQQPQPHDLGLLTPTGPNKHPGPSTGRPGIDYPNYADIPQTSFDCSQQRYKGFFGDPETNCQVWHYCDLNGGKASFLCPNGTIFSQIALTCDWWFNVKCATTPQLYVLNERLYKYILPFTPKFPEDYSGPLVDKYLAMKFQEMEEKMRLDKEKTSQVIEGAETGTEAKSSAEIVSKENKDADHLEETTTSENDSNRHVKSNPPKKQHKQESVNSQVSEQSSERNLLIDDEVDDISQRGTVANFESTTTATTTVTKQTEPISFSLKPIIVSSTLGPDYDDDNLNENEKRGQGYPTDDKGMPKSQSKEKDVGDEEQASDADTETSLSSVPTTFTTDNLQITVEKLDVIEIKPDGATGHLIRDMLLNPKH